MTDERKNEIWAMLSQEEKESFQGVYELKGSYFDKGYNAALNEIFGSHNLTAQAEKEPKKGLLDRIIDTGYNFLDRHNHDVISERGTSNIDYANYRLDLAKEIAVAMIGSNYTTSVSFDRYQLAEDVIETANEIVKRLKETE